MTRHSGKSRPDRAQQGAGIGVGDSNGAGGGARAIDSGHGPCPAGGSDERETGAKVSPARSDVRTRTRFRDGFARRKDRFGGIAR